MLITEKLKRYYIDIVKGEKKEAKNALFSFFLLLFSFIYGFFVKLILFCYEKDLFKIYKPDCKVISVGNISWGGTGKTPLVETLAEFFKQERRKPAILIRGYGQDEVYMLKDKLKDIPVLSGRDRIKNARIARDYGADTLILDDGFQHWRLWRDVDIVLIDAGSPFGNRRLIPRGILREPLSSLARADVFVLTRIDSAVSDIEAIKKELARYNPRAPIYEAAYLPTFLRRLNSSADSNQAEEVQLCAIKNQKIALVAGIADPGYFARTLGLLGAEIVLRFYFPDHYLYSQRDFQKIEKQCLEKGIKYIVTTEKDAARMKPLLKSRRLNIELLALCIKFKITKDEEKFFSFLKNDKDAKDAYSILILNDGKAGHLNQAKAVAGIIRQKKIEKAAKDNGVKIEIAQVRFKNNFYRVLLSACSVFASPRCRRCLWCLKFCLHKDTFRQLMKLPVNLIISAGSSLSSVNLFFSYKNNARSIVLMKPSFLSSNKFDLVIVPEHDRLKPGNNVLVTRIAPNLIDRKYLQEQADILNTQYAIRPPIGEADAAQYETKGPTIGILIGGDTAKYKVTTELINKISFQLKKAADNLDCRILLTTSRRTPEIVERLLKENFADFPACKLLVIANEKNIPEAVGGILGLSDIVLVSGESISMVSEAISAERYVLVFEPEKKVATSTKQERFLKKLEREKILKVISPDALVSEIENLWKKRPYKKKIEDNELIYQALGKII